MELEIVASKLKPVYLQIKEQLEAYILRNNLAPDTMLPSVKTVATEAGVSIRTADQGVKELIKAGICFRRPKKGTFVAEQQKPLLRTKTRKICGVLSDNGLGSFEHNLISAAIYRGMTLEATRHDIDLVFISGKTAAAAERIKFYHNSRDLDLCGIICIKYSEVAESIELAGMFPELRFIDVNYYTDGFELSPDNVIGVFNDDFAGAHQVMQAMLEHGYHKVGIISIPLEDENYRNRIKGFATVIDAVNGAEYCIVRDYDFKEGCDQHQTGYKMMQQLFEKGFEADVVMCVNDFLAAGASSYLQEIERADIRVCGYDNILPEISLNNQFTTASIDFEAMGGRAIKAAQAGSRLIPKIVKVSPLLIVRNKK